MPTAEEENPLDAPEVRDLIEAERARDSAPPAARDAVRAELGVLFGAGAVAAAATLATPARLPRLFTRGQMLATGGVLFGLGVAVGVVGARTGAPPEPRVPMPVVAPSPSPAPPAPSAPEIPSAVVAPPTTAGTVSVARPVRASPSTNATGEDAWIDTAREALSRGLPDQALGATEEHARRYPNGALTEEREALAIQALAALGRRQEAGNRAGSFRKRWPDSLLRRSVDRALE